MYILSWGSKREDIQVIEDLLTKGTTAKPFGQPLPSGIGVAEKKNTARSEMEGCLTHTEHDQV